MPRGSKQTKSHNQRAGYHTCEDCGYIFYQPGAKQSTIRMVQRLHEKKCPGVVEGGKDKAQDFIHELVHKTSLYNDIHLRDTTSGMRDGTHSHTIVTRGRFVQRYNDEPVERMLEQGMLVDE